MRNLSLLSLLLTALCLTSCASFERQWQKSVADYQAGKVASPEGPWEGTWTTNTNGHTGALRAIVTKAEGDDYKFHYHATWQKFLKGGYSVDFPVTRSGSTYKVDGSKSLGIFGNFHHKATIGRNSYEATYSNDKGDLGEFSMRRPQ